MSENKRSKIARAKKQYTITMISSITAIIVIVGITFFTFFFIAKGDAVALGKSSVAEQSEKLNTFLLKSLDTLDVAGTTVDYMLQNDYSSKELSSYLVQQSSEFSKKIDDNLTGVYGVFDGKYIDGVGWSPEEGYDPTTRPWYTEAVAAQGEPVIVSPYVDAKTNSVMVSVSKMLSDGESVIALDIVIDDMQEFAKSINLNGHGYGFIIDENGLVVAHSDNSEKGKNYLDTDEANGEYIPTIAQRVIDGENSIKAIIDGEQCTVFSKEVQDNWHVVMVINNHDLYKRVETNLIVNITLSLVIIGLLAYFINTSYKNRVTAIQYAEELKKYQETLEERVESQTEEIRMQAEKMIEFQESAVEDMAILIEGRDGNTGAHVRNAKKYVSLILDYLYENQMHVEEITISYAKMVENAASLHDVGKIKISDVILNKPGRFTPEEYEIMKLHAEYGGEIVREILGKSADDKLVQVASDVAHYHHEKWDGSGYPSGLKGEEIPICARIMAVADVFDALVSKRVYKDAMTFDEAFDILKKDAGSHFDPEIVDVFCNIKDKVKAHLYSVSTV